MVKTLKQNQQKNRDINTNNKSQAPSYGLEDKRKESLFQKEMAQISNNSRKADVRNISGKSINSGISATLPLGGFNKDSVKGGNRCNDDRAKSSNDDLKFGNEAAGIKKDGRGPRNTNEFIDSSQTEMPSHLPENREDQVEDQHEVLKLATSFMGLQVEGEFEKSTGKSDIKSTGGILSKFLQLSDGDCWGNEETGYTFTAHGVLKDMRSPQILYALPLARIPLGIPGVFAAVDMELEAYSSIDGEFDLTLDLGDNFNDVKNYELINVNVGAFGYAALGVFGGVSAGVPGLGEVKIGGEGTATAQLEGALDLVATQEGLGVHGLIFGVATGRLSALAQAEVLWVKKKWSIPIFDGVIGSFEKDLSGIILTDPKSLSAFSKFKYSEFKKGSRKQNKEEETHLKQRIDKSKEKEKEKKVSGKVESSKVNQPKKPEPENCDKMINESNSEQPSNGGGFGTILTSSSLKR